MKPSQSQIDNIASLFYSKVVWIIKKKKEKTYLAV